MLSHQQDHLDIRLVGCGRQKEHDYHHIGKVIDNPTNWNKGFRLTLSQHMAYIIVGELERDGSADLQAWGRRTRFHTEHSGLGGEQKKGHIRGK